jgi:hypothetical protein
VKSGKSARLFIVGHDQVKTAVLELLSQEPFDVEGQPNPHALRVSDELPEDWFDQCPEAGGRPTSGSGNNRGPVGHPSDSFDPSHSPISNGTILRFYQSGHHRGRAL